LPRASSRGKASAWLARGFVFQFIDLTALTAYLAQYRRFVEHG